MQGFYAYIFSRLLASLSGLYFDGGDESAGERSMVIVMFFVYLFVAMMVLVVDEETLETGLDDAYETFNRDEKWAIQFLFGRSL